MQFYIFEDSKCPKIVLSYPAFNRLDFLEFKVSNKVPVSTQAAIIAINQSPKQVTFSIPLHTDAPQQPHNNTQHPPRPAIKASSQDHQPWNIAPLQDQQHVASLHALQEHQLQNITLSKDHHTVADVHDIIALKCANILLYNWQHALSLHKTPRPLHTPSTTCMHEITNRIQRKYQESPPGNGQSRSHHPCH